MTSLAVTPQVKVQRAGMTVKTTRHPKTPAQRAQETVDVLTRRLAKIRAAKDALEKQVRALVSDEIAVAKRLEYALANPDLPKTA